MFTVPGDVPSEITPESACIVPEGGVKLGSPVSTISLPTLKLLPATHDNVVPAAIDMLVPVPRTPLLPIVSVVPRLSTLQFVVVAGD